MNFKSSLFYSVGGQVLVVAITFSSIVILSRNLTPYEIGIAATASAIYGLLSIVTSLGISSYVVKCEEANEELLRSAFSLYAVFCILLVCMLILFGLLSKIFYNESPEIIQKILTIYCLAPISLLINFRSQAMLQREMKFKSLAVIDNVSGALAAATTIYFSMNGGSYFSQVYGVVVGSVVSTFMHLIFGMKYFGFGVSFFHSKKILKFGFQILTVNGLSQGMTKMSEVLLAKLLGVEAIAIYSRASGLAGQFFFNVYGSFTRVIFSKMSDDFRRGQGLKSIYLSNLNMALGVFWPLVIFFAVTSSDLILFVYGEQWRSSAILFSMLMIANFIVMSFGMNWELFVLKDKLGIQTKLESRRYILGFSFFVIGCTQGLIGVAAAKIFESIAGLIIYLKQVRVMARLRSADIVAVYRNNLILTSVAVAPVVIVREVFMQNGTTNLVRLVISALVLSAFWLMGVIFLKHPILSVIKSTHFGK